jgi:hypothetical protein
MPRSGRFRLPIFSLTRQAYVKSCFVFGLSATRRRVEPLASSRCHAPHRPCGSQSIAIDCSRLGRELLFESFAA